MKVKKYIVAILALFLFLLETTAKPVSKREVTLAVYELLDQWGRSGEAEIEKMDPHYLADGSLAFYMVDLGAGGWVLVSGDDVLQPVLAFSFDNSPIPLGQWTEAAAYLLDLYEKDIRYAIRNPDLKRDVRWDRVDLPSFKGTADDIYIDPFIEVKWNQDAGWNMYCPEDEDGPGGHAYVGCVAVSMAQAMSVYSYPVSPRGMKSYVHEDYGSIAVNYAKAGPYKWNLMSSSSSDEYNAILLYHAAVSVEMGFGADGSGSYVRTAASSMKEYFSYSKNLSFSMRLPNDEQWKSLLLAELEAGRPIVYRGGPDDGRSGHAWNIDGYGNGYFHMNFGWSGSQNGYYTLDLIDPGSNDFSSSQGAMIGIAPPQSAPTDIKLSAADVREGLPVDSYVANVVVEDEDPNNSYTFTCKGKYNVIIDDYLPSSFHVEDGRLLTSKVLSYNEERPELNEEFLLIIVEDKYGNEFKKEFSIKILSDQSGSTGMTAVRLEDDLVYPNPAGDLVYLRNVEQMISLEVFELSTGRLVIREERPENESLDVSILTEGTYLILIRSDGETAVQKLLISR